MSETHHNVPVMFTSEQIQQRVKELGEQITQDCRKSGIDQIKVIGALKGSFVFMADLIRAIDLPVKVDFMEVSSYGDAFESSGNVKIIKDLRHDVSGEHVFIAEDIIDTGLTLNVLYEMLQARKVASLNIVSLLLKKSKSQLKYHAKYIGFDIEDVFVVGYGLDYKGFMRNVPFIGKVTDNNQLTLFDDLDK